VTAIGKRTTTERCAAVRRALRQHGLLPLQDKRWPSLVSVFTGERVAGSWWGHARSHDIFHCLKTLSGSQAVTAHVVSRKITFVHPKLWPALLAIGMTRAPWQMSGLSRGARRKLTLVEKHGRLVTSGAATRELQLRLLVVAQEFHSTAGRHELRLESWRSWATRMQVKPLKSVDEARQLLGSAATSLGADADALPWASAKVRGTLPRDTRRSRRRVGDV
jgi:hypothetical protein